jgi:hypothetical protein
VGELLLSLIVFKFLKAIHPLFKTIKNTKKIIKNILSGNWRILYTQIYKWYQRKKARIAYDISIGFKKLKGVN